MEQELKMQAFENVKNQIGYCGIWCGSCVIGNGMLRQFTEKYKGLLESYGVLEWGPKNIDGEAFLKAIESIESMPLCDGCRQGGGRYHCEIRACAMSKGIDECTQCDTIATCEHSAILEHMRSGASAAGLSLKTEQGDGEQLIDAWTIELKNRLPCAMLFIE